MRGTAAGLRPRSGLRAIQTQPTRNLLILGQCQLMGALTGFMALEMGDTGYAHGAKLWTVYEVSGNSTAQPLPYARLCADAPCGLGSPAPHTFWVDPKDELTSAAGFGSGWLTRTHLTPRSGLILAKLNMLMLNAETMIALTADTADMA